MTEILKIRVQWNEESVFEPRVEALVDHIPKLSDLRFKNHDDIWFAEHCHFCQYFCEDERDPTGYGGARIPIVTIEDDIIILDGPWSSSDGICNSLDVFPHCISVCMTDDENTWEHGYNFIAGSMTVESVQKALDKHMPGIRLVVNTDMKEYMFYSVAMMSNRKNVKSIGTERYPYTRELDKPIKSKPIFTEVLQ